MHRTAVHLRFDLNQHDASRHETDAVHAVTNGHVVREDLGVTAVLGKPSDGRELERGLGVDVIAHADVRPNLSVARRRRGKQARSPYNEEVNGHWAAPFKVLAFVRPRVGPVAIGKELGEDVALDDLGSLLVAVAGAGKAQHEVLPGRAARPI